MRRVAGDRRRGGGAGDLTRLHRRPGNAAHQLRETEVQNLRLSARRHENVGGFEVAVHDALRMRRIEGIDHLEGEIDNGVEWQRLTPRPFSDPLLERSTLQ